MLKTLLSTAELLTASEQFYKNNWKNIIKILLFTRLLYIPGLVIMIILMFTPFIFSKFLVSNQLANNTPNIQDLIAIEFPITFLATYIVILESWGLIAQIIFFYSPEDYTGVWPLFKKARSLVLSYWFLAILEGIILLGGLFFFIIPGFIFYVWFCFSFYELIFEKQKGLNALAASSNIVKAGFWPILRRLISINLLMFALYCLPNLIPFNIVRVIFGIINVFVFTPVSVLYWVLLYKNARELYTKPIESPDKHSKFILYIFMIFAIIFLIGIGILFHLNFFDPPDKFQAPSTPYPTRPLLPSTTPTPTVIPKLIGSFNFEDQQNPSSPSGQFGSLTVSNVTFVKGIAGQAISFSGDQASFAEISNPEKINRLFKSDFSISLWVYRLGMGNSVLLSNSNYHDGGFSLILGNLGEVYCRTSDGKGYVDSFTDYEGKYIVANNGWHSLTVIKEGVDCSIFIDGIDRTSFKAYHSEVKANNNSLFLGSTPLRTDLFQGYLDEIKIYDRNSP